MDKIFKALSEANRRKIITILSKKEMGVNQILSFLDVNQSTLSTHLLILKKAGLVDCRVKGKQRIYFINKQQLKNFVIRLRDFVGEEENIMDNKFVIRRQSKSV